MTVSDRAKALLKVTTPDYLSTFSMPDLFHFMQDLGQSVGGRLALQVSSAVRNLSGIDCQSEGYDLLNNDLQEKETRLEQYKTHRESINKAVHPFDENDEFTRADTLKTQLNVQYTKIRGLAKKAAFKLSLEKGSKVLNQIPDIANGVAHWIGWLKQQTKQLDLSIEEKNWMEKCLLPYAYWQVDQTKKTTKKKDKRLNQYYHNRVSKAKNRFVQNPLTIKMEEKKKEELVNWAFRQVATFHRASSRVEGRNGYLAFVHHANKGITQRRKKVLTVIHNFDIRRVDDKTPAQTLFNKDFPHLFEFILENMDDLPKPRKRKMKTLIKY